MKILLCPECGVYPALGSNPKKLRPCLQCALGGSPNESFEKPLTKAEQAHTLLSQLVANGHCTGSQALEAWDKFKNRPRGKFVPRRKEGSETPEEKAARLHAIAEQTRREHPEWFA